MARLVEERFPKLNGKVEINNIGTTIGSHTGPGMVCAVFLGNKRTAYYKKITDVRWKNKLYWEQLAWFNGAKSENSEMVLQYIWPGCIRIPACCFTAKENDDYEKEVRRKSNCRQKGIAGTCWNCDPWALAVYGLVTLGTILSTNLFSGTSALDLVLSEVFMLVVSLIVGIISAGLGYMLLNISRGKEFSLGDLGYFFQKPARQGDRCRLCAGADPAGHSNPSLLCELYHRSGLTADSQIQWLSMTLGLLAVSTLLNFLISFHLP